MSRVLVESEIDWIGKIPANWNIQPLGLYLKERKEKVSDIDYEPLSVTKNGVVPQLENAAKSDAHDQRKKVCKYDFVINSRSDRKQSCGLSYLEGSVSLINTVLKIYNYYPEYIKYALDNNMFSEEFYRNGHGIVADLWTTKYSEMKHIRIPEPKYDEQIRIANYLNKNCSKIDEIINDNNREVELLEEYKMKILDTACLKGIDKHEFVDVSHYSIDKIPIGWKFQKTLGVLNMPITDGPHSTPNLINDGIPFISADAIKDGKIDFSRKRGDISEEDYLEFSKKYIPKLHDIYMIKSGATTGKVGIVETTDKFTIWSPLAVYRVNEKIMNYKYLYYLLQTNFYQKQVQLSWSYGTQQNIGMRILEKLKVLVPPLSEQEKIVKEIDNKFNKLNKSIDYRKQIIEKLEEYKKSLIYECVTGKREV